MTDTLNWKRITLALTALGLAANALYMLADPAGWYGHVDGVPDTCAICAAASARWIRHAFVPMSAATIFLGLHVGLHLWDVAAGRLELHHLAIDAPGVLGPALITGWLVWWTRNERA